MDRLVFTVLFGRSLTRFRRHTSCFVLTQTSSMVNTAVRLVRCKATCAFLEIDTTFHLVEMIL
jgi:hypothetical protein